MWNRDLLLRSSVGHVDVPRLQAGSVSLQVFTIVTKTPPERTIREDFHCIDGADINTTGLLSVIQGKPLATWFDLRERAHFQARRLQDAIERAKQKSLPFIGIRSAFDLEKLVRSFGTEPRTVGALLGVEGINWLEQASETEIEREIDTLFELGVRQLALTHRFTNSLAGSSEGCVPSRLTARGAKVVKYAQSKGILIDVAHASSETIEDIVAISTKPLLVSHTGIQASCGKGCYLHRNLTNDDIRRIARTGGIIGVGFWPEAVGGGIGSIAEAISKIDEILSEPSFVREMRQHRQAYDPLDHIALGSDFDGAVKTPFDAAGLPLLTHELAVKGVHGRKFSEAELAKIFGGNVCRIFAANLPGGSDALAQGCKLAQLPR